MIFEKKFWSIFTQGGTKVKFDGKTNFSTLMSSEFAGDELSNDIWVHVTKMLY